MSRLSQPRCLDQPVIASPEDLVLADHVSRRAAGRWRSHEIREPRALSVPVCGWTGGYGIVRASELLPSYFAHEGKRVPLGVLQERHPELVIGHLGDEVGLVRESHPASGERAEGSPKIVHGEV